MALAALSGAKNSSNWKMLKKFQMIPNAKKLQNIHCISFCFRRLFPLDGYTASFFSAQVEDFHFDSDGIVWIQFATSIGFDSTNFGWEYALL